MWALAVRAILALVLLVAAVAKLRTRESTRAATVALTGTRFGPALAAALPWVEVALAVALVAWWSIVPGVVATLMLLVFTAVLVRAQARRLPCACFGVAAANAPVGATAILRNAVLVVLAVLATASPR